MRRLAARTLSVSLGLSLLGYPSAPSAQVRRSVPMPPPRDSTTVTRTVAETNSGTSRRTNAALAGYVRDSIGKGIAFAEVYVEEARAATVTDDTGYFRLTKVPNGVTRFTAQRVGYDPVTFEIDMPPELTVNVDIRLRRGKFAVREVSSADSAAPSARLVASGFYDRLDIKQGYMFGPMDVQRMNGYTHVAYLFHNVPGLKVTESADGSRVKLTGESCLNIYIDGSPVNELPDSLSPLDVLALEAYPHYANSPPRYRGLKIRDCGVILVWTKRGKKK
jgi:hypothetical protein